MTHDLQRSYLLPYIPAGRARFFRWLIAEGREQYGFSNPEIWWFLIECDEDHSRELIRLYKVSTWWQRFFPDALTPVGWQRFASWLESRYAITAHSLDYRRSFRPRAHRGTPSGLRMPGRLEAALPEALRISSRSVNCSPGHGSMRGPPTIRSSTGPAGSRLRSREAVSTRPGINVLAFFCYPSGLQESVTWYVHCLQLVGVSTSCRDVPISVSAGNPSRDQFLGLETYDTTLLHVQPEWFFSIVYEQARLVPRHGVYRIAMWWWETDLIPESWKQASKSVDEIWAASRFVADNLRRTLDVPVHHIPLGFELGQVRQVDLSLRCPGRSLCVPFHLRYEQHP